MRLLAWRAADLRHAIEAVQDNHPAGMVLLRALVDLTILTLWIEPRARLHLKLWAAEGERLWLRDDEAVAELLELRGQPSTVTREELAARRARVDRRTERYRRFARRVGVRLPRGAGGSLLPSTRAQARSLAPSDLELYRVGFGAPSAWTHSSAHRIIAEFHADPETGQLQYLPVKGTFARRFSIALEAGQLAAVSRMLGLGIERELNVIRVTAMRMGADGEGRGP